MSKLIIGITGRAGAGKDTAADAILRYADTCTGMAEKISFADPMRAMLRALGVPTEYMVDRELKEKPVPGLLYSYRQLAQTLGTQWGREHHGTDFWVRAAGLRIDCSQADTILIPDVRFPNEAAWVYAQGGFLLRIDRPSAAAINAHESEAYADSLPYDCAIMNTCSLGDLKEGAVEAFKHFVKQRVMSRNNRHQAPGSATAL